MKVIHLALIFLCALCCSSPSHESAIIFDSENGNAIALRIDRSLLSTNPTIDSLTVRLAGSTTDVLGSTIEEGSDFVFTPVVPFTSGLRYVVVYGGREIDVIANNNHQDGPVPIVMAIHPGADTIPENTLKMYILFSEPMVEGKSLKNIVLIRDGADTIRDAFLDLQPELWNENSTSLTLWLDPGRIKRDLIPNKEMGNPLIEGNSYSLFVLSGWDSKAGKKTPERKVKTFFVGPRDEASPDPATWKVDAPKAGTKDPLIIDFGESLDYLSTINSITIIARQTQLQLTAEMSAVDNSIYLYPIANWQKGEYAIQIQSKLEDLAGNNLTRLFDQDILKVDTHSGDAAPRLLHFEVL